MSAAVPRKLLKVSTQWFVIWPRRNTLDLTRMNFPSAMDLRPAERIHIPEGDADSRGLRDRGYDCPKNCGIEPQLTFLNTKH